VAIDGAVLADTDRALFEPPERRRIGLVFQDARLFPHFSVLRNLRYGLRRAPAGRIAFDDVVELLGIGHLLERRPHTLSGGERQRVAIGRALLAQPRLLVMDEPLASLDAPRKQEILPYLLRLKTTLALPILYVTHALDEVARLADTLVLIEAGRSIASGPLAEVASRSDLPLATRDDAGAILSTKVARHDAKHRLTLLQGDGIALWVPLLDAPAGAELRARVPAREVILATDAPHAISVHNVIEGKVRAITEDVARHASLVEVVPTTVLGNSHPLPQPPPARGGGFGRPGTSPPPLAGGGWGEGDGDRPQSGAAGMRSGASALLARVTPDAVIRLGLAPGSRVLALVKSMAVEVFGAGQREP